MKLTNWSRGAAVGTIALLMMIGAPVSAADNPQVAAEIMALARAQWASEIAGEPMAQQNASLAEDYTEFNGDFPTLLVGKAMATRMGEVTPYDKAMYSDMQNGRVQVYGDKASAFTNTQVAKSGRELVMRYAAIVGNYDYVFDWTFMQDGTVGLRVGASGISQAKGTAANTVKEAERRGDQLYGQLVDRGLIGVNHQHIFNLRLDTDIDGQDNTFVTLTPRVVRAPASSRRTSAWVVDERQFDREQDARIDDAEGAQLTVVNPKQHNSLGYPTGYLLDVHSQTSRLLMSDDDIPGQRAAFTQHNVWVTRFDNTQLYAGGSFPNQSLGGDGLPQYIADNASIKNKDIVLWVNVGLTHITRVEDWPLMSVEWFGSIELKPFLFFDTNPGLDISDAE